MSGPFSTLFEIINGTLFAGYCGLIWMFSTFMVRSWREARGRTARQRMMAFYGECGPAIALMTMIAGHAVIRGATWLLRWGDHHGLFVAQELKLQFTIYFLFGLALSVLGCWCVARTFGRPGASAAVIVIALLFGFGMAWPW